MVMRVILALDQHEYSALLKIAIEELRNPSDQAHHILRCALELESLSKGELNKSRNLNIIQKTDEE